MQLKECLSEASWECWCRLCDSTLCTSKFCCKSRQEVVLCLILCQDRYRRKYSESICRQEDYILSCRCRRYWTNDVLNVVDRVRYTSVLCYALVGKVDLSVLVKCNVLKKSVTNDCVVDVWLRLFVKVDNLSVASTLEVEYSVVIPAVLVITDEESLRICGKCCLTCSWKTEEDCCVLSVEVCVSWAVHGSNSLKWKEVVHHREHTFLHLSAVPCVNDNLLFACDVEKYSCLRVKSELFVVLNFSFGSIVNNEIWLEVLKFFLCWLNEHICYEMCLPSYFNDKTDCHTSIFVSTAECIYNEKSLVRELFDCDIFNSCPSFFCSWVVVVLVFIRCPPNCIFGVLIHNDEFIFRRTSCVNSCHNVDSAEFTFLSLFKTFKFRFCFFFE